MLRAMGMVEVDRHARHLDHDAVNGAADAALARGHSLMVFPEGTYSRPGHLDAFKKGAFVIASRRWSRPSSSRTWPWPVPR